MDATVLEWLRGEPLIQPMSVGAERKFAPVVVLLLHRGDVHLCVCQFTRSSEAVQLTAYCSARSLCSNAAVFHTSMLWLTSSTSRSSVLIFVSRKVIRAFSALWRRSISCLAEASASAARAALSFSRFAFARTCASSTRRSPVVAVEAASWCQLASLKGSSPASAAAPPPFPRPRSSQLQDVAGSVQTYQIALGSSPGTRQRRNVRWTAPCLGLLLPAWLYRAGCQL